MPPANNQYRESEIVATIPPLHHEVKVDLDPEQAFELFTKRVGEWWPLGTHSVFGHGGSLEFTDDGRLLERHGDRASSWGEVTEWIPGQRLAMSWHPGRGEDEASHVSVSFAPFGEQTLVTLVHGGWEVYENAVEVRNNYATGWVAVMGDYAKAGRLADEEDGVAAASTWAALLFDPADGQGNAVFDDERFPGHIAFLNEMEEAGYLIAAGPTSDGSGMTILRLPGEGRLEEIEQLAHEDASVKSGLFKATVRPWRVFFAPGVN